MPDFSLVTFIFAVLGMKHRALLMPGKCSTHDLQLQSPDRTSDSAESLSPVLKLGSCPVPGSQSLGWNQASV